MIDRPRFLVSLCFLSVPFAAQASAQFTHNTTDVPTAAVGHTENVDFGDIDGDGDWDAVFADGGDFGNQQNRVWINLGGAQGGVLGVFQDQTATRFPSLLSDARDVELADIDLDGDLDLHTSTTSTLLNQPSRWWINMGALQGGSAGFFQDQTQQRWVNIGVNNGTTIFSSIPAGQALPGGGFLDWCCDSDFGDIDNDGDMDLVHSSYGPFFSGTVPTRLFLNDGLGKYEEFNPSGFQLPISSIAHGQPGLWASGTQFANTLDATGAQCDVASNGLDIELGDIDGDLDLDLLHGSRANPPRMFRNRYQENGGVLSFFFDVTGAVYPVGYATGDGHYAQEMGDMDKDGDLDIYGMSWLVTGGNFGDCTLTNTGNGSYSNIQPVAQTAPDESESDFIDFDTLQSGFQEFAGLIANLVDEGPAYGTNYDHYHWRHVRNGAESVIGSSQGPFDEQTWSGSVTVREAGDWIARRQGAFYAQVNFIPPHLPYQVPPLNLIPAETRQRLADLGRQQIGREYVAGDKAWETDLTHPTHPLTVRQLGLKKRVFYRAMIEALDANIGQLLQRLGPKLANTMVFVVGDNGTESGVVDPQQHDPRRAKRTCYQLGVRTPLIVAGPLVGGPRRTCDAPVGMVDLWRTLRDVTGATELPAMIPSDIVIDSVSYLPLLQSASAVPARRYAFAEVFTPIGNPAFCSMNSLQRMITDGRWKLLRIGQNDEKLFRIDIDPAELNDLRPNATPQALNALRRLRSELDTLINSPG